MHIILRIIFESCDNQDPFLIAEDIESRLNKITTNLVRKKFDKYWKDKNSYELLYLLDEESISSTKNKLFNLSPDIEKREIIWNRKNGNPLFLDIPEISWVHCEELS